MGSNDHIKDTTARREVESNIICSGKGYRQKSQSGLES